MTCKERTRSIASADVQVRMPGGTTHILDITTPGQSAAGKIWKYDGATVGGLTDITY